jgi:hypothetical protein
MLSRALALTAWTCWDQQEEVPFFGAGAPSSRDTIWVAYWLDPRDPSKPNGELEYVIHAAYASYGACWLAVKRENDAAYAIYIGDFRARKVSDSNPVLGPVLTCSPLKNPDAK